jgi:hypothetical protein
LARRFLRRLLSSRWPPPDGFNRVLPGYIGPDGLVLGYYDFFAYSFEALTADAVPATAKKPAREPRLPVGQGRSAN